MTGIALTLDRLSIRVRGVEPAVADAALDGFGEELRRQLARLPVSAFPRAGRVALDLGELEVAADTDARALREALAAHVVNGLTEGRMRAGGGS